jgi:Mrp family chromosome partitioning ATPase
MNEVGQSYSPELGDYAGAVRRRWWFVVALALVGLLLGAAYAKLAPKSYAASASVYVTATGANSNQVANSRTGGVVNLDSEAQVAQSAQVAALAGKSMHSTLSPQALAKQVAVTVPANSQVLMISCDAGSAKGAAACAQAFARAYLQYASNATNQSLKTQISALQDRINSLQRRAGKLASAVASLPSNSPQAGADQSLLGVDKNQLNQYSNQLVALNAQQADSSAGYIISNAVPPAKPASPSKVLALAGGLIVGLFAGLVGALWWDRSDKRIRGPRDVARLGLRVLPSLPLKSRSRPEVAVVPAKSPAGKAFTGLAHAVAADLGQGSHVVMVAGVSSGQGGSLVAANLAAGLARTQPRVILICADMQGSVVPRIMGMPARPGLGELMTGQLSAAEVDSADTGVPRLSVVTPGIDGLSDAAIQRDALERLLSVLRHEARFVVVEAPPLAEAADVYALASLADATLVAAETGRDARSDLREGVQRLEQLGSSLLGVLILPRLQRDDGEMYAATGEASPGGQRARLTVDAVMNGQSSEESDAEQTTRISGQALGPTRRS